MKYYKHSKKSRVFSAIIVVVVLGCMVATTLLACLL